MKTRLLCILHLPPPVHGAAKVGEFIRDSHVVNEAFVCRYIPILSSDTIGDIGKISLKKFWLVAILFFRVLWALMVFRPDKIYVTVSVKSVAFYRDLLISLLWKTYAALTDCDIYYHYHTKGIDDFVAHSLRSLRLTRFFLKGINLVLLSPMLEKDFEKVKTYNRIGFLPNGIEDVAPKDFEDFVKNKYSSFDELQVLYLSNMIKEKGYFEVLKLAEQSRDEKIHYHFAGSWQNKEDEKEFFRFINEKELQSHVTFHGYVNGAEKASLLEKAHLLIFPTRYKAEAFALVTLEAISYGVPVISTDEGSISSIIDEQSGIVLKDVAQLPNALREARENLVNAETARYCRRRYLENFTRELFERNLMRVLNKQ